MPTRRAFLTTTFLTTASAMGLVTPLIHALPLAPTSQRPPKSQRRYQSEAIENIIRSMNKNIGDKKLRRLFENCFPNTLDTTVELSVVDGAPDAFIITGDIDAMWLRDSTAQIWPYLPYARDDKALLRLFHGAIGRQARSILIDPYANAFMKDPNARTNLEWSQSDITDMKPGVAERKWEIDSLCYPIRLAYGYWKTVGDLSPFDATWRKAMKLIYTTFKQQQRIENKGPYSFQRRSNVPTETLPFFGFGAPTKKVGMIHSGFRPSDDACTYPFLIPSNHFAVVSLRQLAELAVPSGLSAEFAQQCTKLSNEVELGLKQHGTLVDKRGKTYWAYEVDGYGNTLFMDDANIPSLLSLPYLGAVKVDDPVYQQTRAALWSDRNPYFFSGTAGEGVGGPHAGLGLIWPMSLIMRSLTSSDDNEIKQSLQILKSTDAGTGFMHETFNKDDPSIFTRSWFAWANTLFGELILDLYKRKPHLLR